MKIYVAVARPKNYPDDIPWVVNAMDEYSLDSIGEGVEYFLTTARAPYGLDTEIRLSILHVSDEFLERVFAVHEETAREEVNHE